VKFILFQKLKHSTLSLLVGVFYFIVKTMFAFNVAKKLMKHFHFIEGKVWNYDPYRMISNVRVVFSYAPLHSLCRL